MTKLTNCDIILLGDSMFANRLKEIRKEKNMTQVQLAEALGVSKGTVAMWEIGKRQPNFETLNALSAIFDKKIDYILGYSNDSSSARITETEIEQLGVWETEENFHETIMAYLQLDEFGKHAVESVIKAEFSRCMEHGSLSPKEKFMLSLRIRNSKIN